MYHDFRYGDTFEIHFTGEHQFEAAYRYRGQVGVEPIFYENIDDIPAHHQKAVEDIVWKYGARHAKLK
jgi:hypothetical protein